MPEWSSIPLALGAATLFALTAALQHRSASRERRLGVADPRLLLRLLTRPLWLSSLLSNAGAVALQIAAFRAGTLVIVQALIVSSIVLAIPLEAALNGRRVQPRQLAGGSLAAIGLAVFVAFAHPASGISAPPFGEWLTVTLASAAVVLACLLGARTSAAHARAIFLGLGTGVVYGLAAALLKACSEQLSHPVALLASWPVYLLIALGIFGVILNQNVYQAGALAPGLTSMTLAEPLTALAIGVAIFREHIPLSPENAGGIVAALVSLPVALWLIHTSPAPAPQVDRH